MEKPLSAAAQQQHMAAFESDNSEEEDVEKAGESEIGSPVLHLFKLKDTKDLETHQNDVN